MSDENTKAAREHEVGELVHAMAGHDAVTAGKLRDVLVAYDRLVLDAVDAKLAAAKPRDMTIGPGARNPSVLVRPEILNPVCTECGMICAMGKTKCTLCALKPDRCCERCGVLGQTLCEACGCHLNEGLSYPPAPKLCGHWYSGDEENPCVLAVGHSEEEHIDRHKQHWSTSSEDDRPPYKLSPAVEALIAAVRRLFDTREWHADDPEGIRVRSREFKEALAALEVVDVECRK